MQGIIMSDKNASRASWNLDSMIENAKSLQRVAKAIYENGHEAAQSDIWLE